MQKVVIAALIFMLAVPAFGAEKQKSDDSKTFYAIGLVVASQLKVFNLTPTELESVKQGITDGVTGTPTLVDLKDYNGKIQELAKARRIAYGEKLSSMSKDLLAKAAKEKGAVKTKSGLIYIPEKEGKGSAPTLTDKVKVNYRGTLADGKEFDSSYKRGEPTEFPLDKVISCWKEGLQLMKPGGKARLICPPETAYGENGNAFIPPNATLLFDVELLDVKK
jgi:FKBP-type peptidyl-prolyl cis-trans isomerase FkpA